MGSLSPASVLYDADGHAIGVVLDGSIYRLQMLSKVSKSNGDVINPATEDGNLASIKGKTDNLPSDPAREGGNLATLAGKDFATQTTLSAIKGKTDNLPSDPAREGGNLATLAGKDFATQTTLALIKDTDGIKKIIDQLPAGTNEIGKVAQGSKGAGDNAWPQVLYDSAGHAVGVVQDDSVYRLQIDGKIGKFITSGALTHLAVLDATNAVKTTLYTPGGDPISFPGIAADPSGIVDSFVEQSGGTDKADLRVNGSSTPVDFTFSALGSGQPDIAIQSVGFVMVAASIVSGSGKFAGLTKLTNGVKLFFKEGSTETEIGVIYENEDFMHFASVGGYDFWALNKDQMQSIFYVSGAIVLHGGHSDSLIVRISDNLSSGIDYFKCYVKAIKRGA